MMYRINRNLALFATTLALVVVLLGAYTRLKDAGLGCPDWPGCYGSLTVPSEVEHIEQAEQAFPERPVEAEKAWAEMIHRYFASSLGLTILIIAFLAWRQKKSRQPQLSESTGFSGIKLPLFLVVLVIFQGMLGMWTVTMKLNPAVVMSHLLGGMTTFSLLSTWALINQNKVRSFNISANDSANNRRSAAIALIFVVLQIALGAWTSANYAAQVCVDLPICQGDWWQNLRPVEAFKLWGHGADNYEFGVKSLEARSTIHITHRLWALFTMMAVFWASWKLITSGSPMIKSLGKILLVLVLLQFALGVSNVFFHLPLAIAVAHNGGGALLLALLVMINVTLRLNSSSQDQDKS